MEAEQYKRLAEEKICHAEESFAVIEDIITEREMEVSDLEYQVQTYRHKLLSMGWVDPAGTGDVIFPGNLVLSNGNSAADLSLRSIARRNSEPTLVKMAGTETPVKTDMNWIPKAPPSHDQELDKKIDHEGVSAYTDQIKKLDLLVKELAGRNYTNKAMAPSHDLTVNSRTKDKDISPVKCQSPGIHDIFEVPQIDKDCCFDESSSTKENSKSKHVKPYGKDENDWLKKLLQSVNSERHLCKPSNVAAVERPVPVPVPVPVPKPTPVARNLNSESGDAEEQLKLLKEIKEELSSLQNEMRDQEEEKPSTSDDMMLSLSEIMLHIWL